MNDPNVALIRAAILEALDGKPWLFWDEDEDLANAQRVDFADRVVAWLTRQVEPDFAERLHASAATPFAPSIGGNERPTEEMVDSVRGVLQILRGKPGATYADVLAHCDSAGYDWDRWPAWIKEQKGYVTESGAASMIYEIMQRFAPSANEFANSAVAEHLRTVADHPASDLYDNEKMWLREAAAVFEAMDVKYTAHPSSTGAK